jgi:hypothetical protein
MSILCRVRFVVMRPSLLAFAMCLSSMSYSDDSVYTDPSSKLMWMRCTIGQKWVANDCKGEAIKMTWADAMKYPSLFNENGFSGKNNWRLPTISELSTLRRCSNGWSHEIIESRGFKSRQYKDMGIRMISLPNGNSTLLVPSNCATKSSSPTLDTNIFPNTKRDEWYWSSSLVPFFSGSRVYAVDFNFGSMDRLNVKNVNEPMCGCYLRLVRSVQ